MVEWSLTRTPQEECVWDKIIQDIQERYGSDYSGHHTSGEFEWRLFRTSQKGVFEWRLFRTSQKGVFEWRLFRTSQGWTGCVKTVQDIREQCDWLHEVGRRLWLERCCESRISSRNSRHGQNTHTGQSLQYRRNILIQTKKQHPPPPPHPPKTTTTKQKTAKKGWLSIMRIHFLNDQTNKQTNNNKQTNKTPTKTY